MTIDLHRRPIPNPPIAREDITFSHPSEAEFARLLDFYGIDWRYEPMVYPIEWDEHGAVTEAFAPDFYLVAQDCYIELTTMRQSLTRIKRHKIQRLQQLYPEVRIRLWNRHDFERLLSKYGMMAKRSELIGHDALTSSHGQTR
ncbi:MAG: hypothetical protein ABFD20_13055 [Anaerolineales bacterium]